MALSINANNNEKAGAWEFKLVGEIDLSNAHYFKQQMEAALTEKCQNISVDLANLNYIDSTGLGVIISVYGTIKKDGHCIKLLNPRDNVKKLLSISGLDKILC
ncbi:MAG: STAS domain-containing protein [Clostridiales Family XIII bacterium]|jgi:anti-sigma B factor antagonist|nr:STAS domain-containing protein [Clostridiales Family XIII bacterium]